MYIIAFVFFLLTHQNVCDAKFEFIRPKFIIFIIFKTYFLFLNVIPRINFVFKMKIDIMRRNPGVLPQIRCDTVTNFSKIRYNGKYTSIFEFFSCILKHTYSLYKKT